MPPDYECPIYEAGAHGQWYDTERFEQISTEIPAISDLETGYLLFLDTSDRGFGYIVHVGMYVGGGYVIHSRGSAGVEKKTLNQWLNLPAPGGGTYGDYFFGYGRVKAAPPPVSLGEAVDNTDLSWSTGGDADWFGQTETYYYDGDAAESGDISDNPDTWMETTVSGPGTLSFYWKVSSESGYDYLRFYIDGAQQDSIAGSTSWAQKTYSIGSGSHTLTWKYIKDGSVSHGEDCGWVDKVEFSDKFFVTAYYCIYKSEIDGTQTVTKIISGTTYTLKASFLFGGYGVAMQGTGRIGPDGDYIHYQGGGDSWAHIDNP